ncbi:MAG: Hsp33 family molecular chaperone HslO [Pseudomonadota bacterium]
MTDDRRHSGEVERDTSADRRQSDGVRTPQDDTLQRFSFPVLAARGQFVTLADTWKDATASQTLPDAARRAVGEAMAVAALLADGIKFDGRVALQARGDGAISTLLGECTNRETLRGYARLDDDAEAAIAAGELGLGTGQLAISLIPERGELHQGIVELKSNIAAAIEHYFLNSEQLPTLVATAVDDERVCALLLQQLPSSSTAESEEWDRLAALFQTCSEAELLSLQRETLLKRLFASDTISLHAARPLRFACSCSRERSEAALKMLGPEELIELTSETNGIEISCEICGTTYHWDTIEAHLLFATDDPQVH